MGKGDKFANLHRYFSQLDKDEVAMTFKELESIIGEKLSKSAYQYQAYWYDSPTHMLPKCWVENDYKMTSLNLKEQKVIFTKVGSQEKVQKTTLISSPSNIVSLVRKQPTITISEVSLAVNKYISEIEQDENARYLSWEHCYKVFKEFHNKESITNADIEYLSLHLAFYLASWGMLRGSSFLLQKDYKVHTDIVKELYKPCYNSLWGIKYEELKKQENLNCLFSLIENLKTMYRAKRKNIKEVGTDISDILITKVLLGTMGCIPAYDEYFKKGVAKNNITTQLLSKTSVMGLADYYEEFKTELEELRTEISNLRKVEYPQMKILDMAFWQLGFDNN